MNKVRGSQWRKWDLHFHTPSSYDYKNKEITNQDIIDGLAAKNVSVVAVTDHHVIDVERIKKLQELGKEKNITVLPGIEFLSDARGDEPIHFIAIFDENSDINYIWKQIESRTDIHRIEGERKKINEVYCHLFDTIQIVKEHSGIVTIHAGGKANSIDNITHSLPHGQAQKIDIAQAVDIFELGKESDHLDYSEKVIPFLRKKINKHIPLIICSDNHLITDYIVKQNLWVKADPTFEGLRQIIYEPDHRVRIQKDEPDFKEDKLIIDEIRFISNNNKFNPAPICLNKNLNVIIGGKSSGKSILLYHIARTLLADQDFFKKEQIENKYDFRAYDETFNFEIKTRGGFPQLMYRNPDENSIIPEIKYIPQNYLVRLAEPDINKTGNALNKMVRDLINEDRDSKQIYDDFISAVKANDRKREGIIDTYFDIKDKISTLEAQLKLKSNRDILLENITSNTQKVEELNKSTGMSEEDINNYNTLQRQLDDNKLQRTTASNDFKKISEFNEDTYNTLISLRTRKALLMSSLENETFKQLFNDEYTKIDDLIQQLEPFRSNFEIVKNEDGSSRFKTTSAISQIFTNNTLKANEITNKLQPYLENQEIKKQIDIIQKSISDDKAALQSIDQLNKEISENTKALEHEKQTLFALYEDNYQLYLKVIEDLKLRTVDLEKDGLKIHGFAKFNFPKFCKALFKLSDGRKASYNNFAVCDTNRDSLAGYKLNDLVSDVKDIFESIAETGTYALLGKAEKKAAIKVLLDDYFFDYWEIEYKGDKLGKMSTGKASFVILMLIIGLSKSKAPILIDQPEDNLDNRSITTDLVEYLKNKKLERQIILVTHNANIVVNADAENIVIAHQKGQGDTETNSPYQFDYINGSLENSFPKNQAEKNLLKSMGIREHIADIVEGGKEAFKKREEKYGFK